MSSPQNAELEDEIEELKRQLAQLQADHAAEQGKLVEVTKHADELNQTKTQLDSEVIEI